VLEAGSTLTERASSSEASNKPKAQTTNHKSQYSIKYNDGNVARRFLGLIMIGFARMVVEVSGFEPPKIAARTESTWSLHHHHQQQQQQQRHSSSNSNNRARSSHHSLKLSSLIIYPHSAIRLLVTSTLIQILITFNFCCVGIEGPIVDQQGFFLLLAIISVHAWHQQQQQQQQQQRHWSSNNRNRAQKLSLIIYPHSAIRFLVTHQLSSRSSSPSPYAVRIEGSIVGQQVEEERPWHSCAIFNSPWTWCLYFH